MKKLLAILTLCAMMSPVMGAVIYPGQPGGGTNGAQIIVQPTYVTNFYLFNTNIYIQHGNNQNNVYVSNYFQTNVFLNVRMSNFFTTNVYMYVTNVNQTNLTVTNFYAGDTFVSNYFTTNLFVNNPTVSNFFTTNIYQTTMAITTNYYSITTNLSVLNITNNYLITTNLYVNNTYTNAYLFNTNLYISYFYNTNNTYVSNYFLTNVFLNTYMSNYFNTNIYSFVTNINAITSVTNYFAGDTFVSNYFMTNIFVNNSIVSNFFTTNLFQTYNITSNYVYNVAWPLTNATLYGTTTFSPISGTTAGYISILNNGVETISLGASNAAIATKTVWFATNRWAGPTNTFPMDAEDQYYNATSHISITNLTSLPKTGYGAGALLSVTNSWSTNLLLILAGTIRIPERTNVVVLSNTSVGIISIHYSPQFGTQAVYRQF